MFITTSYNRTMSTRQISILSTMEMISFGHFVTMSQLLAISCADDDKMAFQCISKWKRITIAVSIVFCLEKEAKVPRERNKMGKYILTNIRFLIRQY